MARAPKLNDTQMAEVARALRNGIPVARIAEEHGVHIGTIHKWKTKFNWPVAVEQELKHKTEEELQRRAAKGETKGEGKGKGETNGEETALAIPADPIAAEASRRADIIEAQQKAWHDVEDIRRLAVMLGGEAGEKKTESAWKNAIQAADLFERMARATAAMQKGAQRVHRIDLTPDKVQEDPAARERKSKLAAELMGYLKANRERAAALQAKDVTPRAVP